LIRFGGCNFGCSFCDSSWTNKKINCNRFSPLNNFNTPFIIDLENIDSYIDFIQKKFLSKYNIKTVTSPIFLQHAVIDEEKIQEYNRLIVSTNTMSKKDFVDSLIFSYFIQSLHCMSLTQYISIFLYFEEGLSYENFYNKLILFAKNNPKTIIGKQYKTMLKIIKRAMKGSGWGYHDEKFGNIIFPIEEAIFLNVVTELDQFYSELKIFLKQITNNKTIDDLLLFISRIIINPYTKNDSKLNLKYDFMKYFKNARIGKYSRLMEKDLIINIKNIKHFNGDLVDYAKEVVWYGRRSIKFISNITVVK
jgi:hypothetical protein